MLKVELGELVMTRQGENVEFALRVQVKDDLGSVVWDSVERCQKNRLDPNAQDEATAYFKQQCDAILQEATKDVQTKAIFSGLRDAVSARVTTIRTTG